MKHQAFGGSLRAGNQFKILQNPGETHICKTCFKRTQLSAADALDFGVARAKKT